MIKQGSNKKKKEKKIEMQVTKSLLKNNFTRFYLIRKLKVIPQYCIAHPYCARFLRH